jgi:hypothetical protein
MLSGENRILTGIDDEEMDFDISTSEVPDLDRTV